MPHITERAANPKDAYIPVIPGAAGMRYPDSPSVDIGEATGAVQFASEVTDAAAPTDKGNRIAHALSGLFKKKQVVAEADAAEIARALADDAEVDAALAETHATVGEEGYEPGIANARSYEQFGLPLLDPQEIQPKKDDLRPVSREAAEVLAAGQTVVVMPNLGGNRGHFADGVVRHPYASGTHTPHATRGSE